MLNIKDIKKIEVLEVYIKNNLDRIDPVNAYALGRSYLYSFNLLNTYYGNPNLLSSLEFEQVQACINLFKLCGISEDILKMSKEDLLDLLGIEYYVITDNTKKGE